MSGKKHIVSLDGLRGLAALSVVIGHSAGVFADSAHPTGLTELICRTLKVPGHPAVILFFALSGVVLTLALRPGATWGSYMVRRLFRLLPAVLAAILISAALLLVQDPVRRANLGPWVQSCWADVSVTITAVFRNAFLIGLGEKDVALDPVLWSLVLELRFSALLIPLVMLARWNRWTLLALAPLAYFSGWAMFAQQGLVSWTYVGDFPLGSLAVFLLYAPGFLLGVWLGHEIASGRALPKLSSAVQIAVAAAGAALVTALDNDLLTACVALAVIAMAATPGLLNIALSSAPCRLLGRLSYSLYLVHFPILMACAYGLGGTLGLVPAITIAPVISLGLAALLERYVEKPGIAVGQAVTRRMAAGPLPSLA